MNSLTSANPYFEAERLPRPRIGGVGAASAGKFGYPEPKLIITNFALIGLVGEAKPPSPAWRYGTLGSFQFWGEFYPPKSLRIRVTFKASLPIRGEVGGG